MSCRRVHCGAEAKTGQLQFTRPARPLWRRCVPGTCPGAAAGQRLAQVCSLLCRSSGPTVSASRPAACRLPQIRGVCLPPPVEGTFRADGDQCRGRGQQCRCGGLRGGGRRGGGRRGGCSTGHGGAGPAGHGLRVLCGLRVLVGVFWSVSLSSSPVYALSDYQ